MLESVTFHLLELSLRNNRDLAQQVQDLETGYFLDAFVKELHQTQLLDPQLHYLEQISLRDILEEPEHMWSAAPAACWRMRLPTRFVECRSSSALRWLKSACNGSPAPPA
jgi:hypothetical protein